MLYIINYGTNQYYENIFGDKYYCKTPQSARKKISELLKNDKLDASLIKEIIKPLDTYIFNGCKGVLPNLEYKIIYNDDLYIGISERDLI